MRVTNKAEGDLFAKKIASHVCTACSEKRVIAVDQPKADTKEEAKQCAISYWMMGWTWDEIEVVLEDSEYNKETVSYAIKEAKKYAREMLSDGPFRTLEAGQGVKLINGEVGALEDRYADHVTVSLAGHGKVKVTEKQIDLEATAKLHKAFTLRKQAEEMISNLPGTKLAMLRSAAATVVRVSLENQDKGLAAEVKNALSKLSSLQQESDELNKAAKDVSSTWKEDHEKWETKSKDEYAFAQYVAAIIGQEAEVDSSISNLVRTELKANLEKVYDALSQGASLDNELQEALATNFPRVSNLVESHIFELHKKNAAIQDYTNRFNVSDDTSKWVDDALTWAKRAWTDTQKFVDTWENEGLQAVNTLNHAAQSFLQNANKEQTTQKVTAMLAKNQK